MRAISNCFLSVPCSNFSEIPDNVVSWSMLFVVPACMIYGPHALKFERNRYLRGRVGKGMGADGQHWPRLFEALANACTELSYHHGQLNHADRVTLLRTL
eukprot:scaffold154409_cov13-Prasinocladus_malaysianus.AAC.1